MEPEERRRLVSRATAARLVLRVQRVLLHTHLADGRECRANAEALRNEAHQIRRAIHHRGDDPET